MDALRLVELGNKYNIKRNTDAHTKEIEYEIESKEDAVACVISREGKIDYYVSGAYNSGSDFIPIEMETLMELKEFGELIIKFNNRGE